MKNNIYYYINKTNRCLAKPDRLFRPKPRTCYDSRRFSPVRSAGRTRPTGTQTDLYAGGVGRSTPDRLRRAVAPMGAHLVDGDAAAAVDVHVVHRLAHGVVWNDVNNQQCCSQAYFRGRCGPPDYTAPCLQNVNAVFVFSDSRCKNVCKMLADLCPRFHRSPTKLCPDLVSFVCWIVTKFWSFTHKSVPDFVSFAQ